MGDKLTELSIRKPKALLLAALFITAISLLRVGNVTVDTDPENMLSPKEQVRIFHNRVKEEFALSDMIVLGVVDEEDRDGVFNPGTLGRVYRITEGIKRIEGVVASDLMSLSTVDDILQAGPGSVRFKYVMEEPPGERKGAIKIRDRAMSNPLLYGTLVSEDGKALAIYIPIEEKSIAHRVSQEVQELIGREKVGTEEYHITGLPVAEDTFGVQMFVQMAISAPLACLIIFLIMLFFFRQLVLVISPMIVAILTVLISMGTLIATGNTLHIMSSMIPVFLMPIAVVDSVHILSVFFDRYQQYRDREKTIRVVMRELFTPMLYTSLTTLVGFGSLVLAPIPPVRVFGLFVAFGVFVAWILTITLVPAYIMVFIPESKLENFGAGAGESEEEEGGSILARALVWSGKFSRGMAKPLLAVIGIVLMIAIYGITRIQINDNPVKWFVKDHPVRVADEILNRHFGGTYEAYLIFEPELTRKSREMEVERVARFLKGISSSAPAGEGVKIVERLEAKLASLSSDMSEEPGKGPEYLIEGMSREVADITGSIPGGEGPLAGFLYDLEDGIEDLRIGLHTFKDPEVLRYVEKLQDHIVKRHVVGKSNGLTDLVKKVHQELLEGRPEMLRIPDTPAAVAQTIITFQGSHDPDEVWHLVTPDFRRLNLWIQLKSGDNRDMEEVVSEVESFIDQNPPPLPLDHSWAGLTYLNVVWQEKMVFGMLYSLMGSFAIVLLLMSFLFRSILFGLISMIPLSVTIVSLYGTIGIIGRDYDMVMAVLSSLTLGMSVDFAIHYIERTRELVRETGSWERAAGAMSKAPSRAITRNAIIIAVGFLPLLLSNLTPYRSVGIFLAAIMTVSGVGTLLIMPALMQIFSRYLFRKELAGVEGEDE